MTAPSRSPQICTSADQLALLRRSLARIRGAEDAQEMIDAGVAYSLTCWTLPAWVHSIVWRDPPLRHRMARDSKVLPKHLTAEVIAIRVCERTPDFEICYLIATRPDALRIGVIDGRAQLVVIDDGEPVAAVAAFERVAIGWTEFLARHGLIIDEKGSGQRHAA